MSSKLCLTADNCKCNIWTSLSVITVLQRFTETAAFWSKFNQCNELVHFNMHAHTYTQRFSELNVQPKEHVQAKWCYLLHGLHCIFPPSCHSCSSWRLDSPQPPPAYKAHGSVLLCSQQQRTWSKQEQVNNSQYHYFQQKS